MLIVTTFCFLSLVCFEAGSCLTSNLQQFPFLPPQCWDSTQVDHYVQLKLFGMGIPRWGPLRTLHLCCLQYWVSHLGPSDIVAMDGPPLTPRLDPVHCKWCGSHGWHLPPLICRTAGKASHCPQPPHFPLKDQFFMVLVLIVFILFKSVFLYVEGNNFLNTNH